MPRLRDGVIKRGGSGSYVIRVPDPATRVSKPKWVGGFDTEEAAKAARDEARIRARRGEFVNRSPCCAKVSPACSVTLVTTSSAPTVAQKASPTWSPNTSPTSSCWAASKLVMPCRKTHSARYCQRLARRQPPGRLAVPDRLWRRRRRVPSAWDGPGPDRGLCGPGACPLQPQPHRQCHGAGLYWRATARAAPAAPGPARRTRPGPARAPGGAVGSRLGLRVGSGWS